VLPFRSVDSRVPHLVLEAAAYFLAARLYWRQVRLASPSAAPAAPRDRFFLLACAVFGAAVGAKTLHALEHLPALLADQRLSLWLGGKSVLGGFLGGTIGVELGKAVIGHRRPTGDVWVAPIVVGLVVGRLGCQVSGVWDQTYGTLTAAPWAWDYGDGLPRHPVAAYEALIMLVLFVLVRSRWPDRPGARFAALLMGYCVARVGLELLKPPFGLLAPGTLPVALYGGLTAIQWAACVGAVWYAMLLRRRLRPVAASPESPVS
jgi:phosphatidylglycerol---prolipoprotein diacylglyceryl transferase